MYCKSHYDLSVNLWFSQISEKAAVFREFLLYCYADRIATKDEALKKELLTMAKTFNLTPFQQLLTVID